MDKEFYEQFYPSEKFVYGDSYTSTPNDLQLYVQQYDGGQEENKWVVYSIEELKTEMMK